MYDESEARAAITCDRRRLVPSREVPWVPHGVHADGNQGRGKGSPGGEHEPPAAAAGEHNERRGEERAQQATARVRVGDESDQQSGETTGTDRVPLEPRGALEHEQEQDDEERLCRGLDRHPSELEQPRREPGEHDDDRRDPPAMAQPSREYAKQKDRREHEHGRQATRDRLARPGDPEDTREEVRVDGALVVVERAEEEREAGPVLVAKARRQRVGIERERGLIAVIAGRVRRTDPQLEGDNSENRAEPEEAAGRSTIDLTRAS